MTLVDVHSLQAYRFGDEDIACVVGGCGFFGVDLVVFWEGRAGRGRASASTVGSFNILFEAAYTYASKHGMICPRLVRSLGNYG
jgi:hypothetical protein